MAEDDPPGDAEQTPAPEKEPPPASPIEENAKENKDSGHGFDTEIAKCEADMWLRLCELHWKDLHHNRNQDWMFWAILIATGIGMGQIDGSYASSVVTFLAWAGCIVSVGGMLISLKHRAVLYEKTQHMTEGGKLVGRHFVGDLKEYLDYEEWKKSVELRFGWWISAGWIIFFLYSLFFMLYLAFALDCSSFWTVFDLCTEVGVN